MWWIILTVLLLSKSRAQLTSSSQDFCPGNRITFSCQLSGTVSQWRIILPSIMLINPALSSQVGSILSFPNDPGFNFEVHIVSWSNESNMITSELKVIAKRQLNGVTVECSGFADSFMSVIHITSADDPPPALTGVMTFFDHYTKTGASVTISWLPSRSADSYFISIISLATSQGQTIANFTTTESSLQLGEVEYNVNYIINVTAQNCAGGNSTTLAVTVAGCGPPSPLNNGRINDYHNGSIGSLMFFQCNTGYLPHDPMTSTCMVNGSWIPNPHCTCVLADNVREMLSCTTQVANTAVVCSVAFFLFGILVGVLCHRWAAPVFMKPYNKKHSNETEHQHSHSDRQAAVTAPVLYEEVKLSSDPTHSEQIIELQENAAYGPIRSAS